jgi:hypothetical protein
LTAWVRRPARCPRNVRVTRSRDVPKRLSTCPRDQWSQPDYRRGV